MIEDLGRHTVIGLSSGNLRAAIGLIRISGPDDFSHIASSFKFNPFNYKARYNKLNYILDKDGHVLDQVLTCFFKGPNSFTGNDTLEIQCHGNPLIIKSILDHFKEIHHLRSARPGEFSYQAFINGKLNLSQIEGLDILLNSNSEILTKSGFKLFSGEIQNSYSSLYDLTIQHKSFLELAIDFSDDVGLEDSFVNLEKSLEDLYQLVGSLRKQCHNKSSDLLNPTVTLLGEPNAGKSSLFNLLLGYDRSIVSSEKGTTRDFISQDISWGNGVRTSIVDTAGIRETTSEIEKKGIKHTSQVYKNSFFNLLLINVCHDRFLDIDNEISLIDYCHELELALEDIDLVLFTHVDLICNSNNLPLSKHGSIEPLQKLSTDYFKSLLLSESGSIEPQSKLKKQTGPIEPEQRGDKPGSIGPVDFMMVSLLGLSDLKLHHNHDFFNRLSTLISSKFTKLHNETPIVLDRHIESIDSLSHLVSEYYSLYKNFHTTDLGLVAHRFHDIHRCVEELVGLIPIDDIYENIFSNFCIGK